MGSGRRPIVRPAWLLTSAVVAGAVALLARPAPVSAHANGIVTDSCEGCHGSGATPPDLTLTPDRATFNPGDSVTFTLTIRWSSIRVGGTFITTGGVGTLQALAGEGLALSSQGLTHTAPKAAVNGAVTFRFGWQAPSKRGGVDVHVAALAANGNNAPSGDSPGMGDFQWVYGCTAQTFYGDLDRDGYGSKDDGTMLGCMGDPPPEGYAAQDGDCDENDEKIHPGATEICNMKDDNCNGQIDENAPPVMMWPDADGDGYYRSPPTGMGKLGCGNVPGYAAQGGDCDDSDPTIHPGATEICNMKDDNCDGEIDERVRPQCGTGWCARYSPTCNPADCHPGPPAVETCNQFDDDCDGQIDNGACPGGMVCSGTQCVPGVGGSQGSPAGGMSGVMAGPAGAVGSVGAGGSSPAQGGTSGHRAGDSSASGCTIAASGAGDGKRADSGDERGDGRGGWALVALLLGSCILLARARPTNRRR